MRQLTTPSQRYRKPIVGGILLLSLLGTLMAAPLSARSSRLPDLADSSEGALAPRAEQQLGAQTMHKVHASGSYFNDPEVNAYLDSLGQRLIAADAQISGKFEFFAVPSAEINAFALPGGYIGVNTGLMIAAESEGELASVLAHEIAHVTQRHIARSIEGQSGPGLSLLTAVAAAVLAARSGNPQVASAAMTSIAAAQQQSQIDSTRENELEADRLAFQLLDKAGFDQHAMAEFFMHLGRVERIHDSQVPGYLRDHPLTSQRISEAQDRAHGTPYRQVEDSLDFHLTRALLRSYEGEPENAVTRFKSELDEGRYRHRTAARYGYAAALLRSKDYPEALRQVAALERAGLRHPMLESLAAIALQQSGQGDAAQHRYRAALARYPNQLQLIYDYPRTLIADRQYQAAARFVEAQLNRRRNDATLHQLAAEANGALGKNLRLHYHQGELYAAQGNPGAAAEQFELAVRANDGSFQDLLIVENRLREMRPAAGGPGRPENNRKEPSRQSLGPGGMSVGKALAATTRHITQ